MKKSDIGVWIKHEIESHLPDKPMHVDWDYIEKERIKENIVLTKKSMFFRPLRLSISFALMVLFGLGIWWMFSQSDVIPPGTVPSGETIFNQEKEVLPLSFLSTAALLPSQMTIDSNTVTQLTQTTTLTDPIKPFLKMIELIISQNQGPIVAIKTSDLDDYETLIVIETFDLLGQKITYQLYYNVLSYENKNGQTTFEIEGLMINNHVSYPMIGRKEIEDGEEKLIVRGILSQNAYIETIYETEDDELKYIIKRVENNQVVFLSKLKHEKEDGETKIELEIIDQLNKASYKLEYENNDNRPAIKIEYAIYTFESQSSQSGEMKIFVVLDQLTSLTNYQFNIWIDDEEFIEEYERENRHDDDDEEDDNEDDDEEDEEDEDDDDDY